MSVPARRAAPEPDEGPAPGATPAADPLDAALARGLEFLRRSQLPSGEFRVLVSTDHALERDAAEDPTPFATALVAYSLGLVEGDAARALLDRAVGFLQSTMEAPGVWRYWTRRHPHHAVIPPDVDDTACASQVLRANRVPLPPNDAVLLAARDRRGLFYTWITPRWPPPVSGPYWRVALRQLADPARLLAFWRLNESKPNDVDCVVNANVLLYLGDCEATRPVTAYLLDVIRQEREGCCDKWHLNRFMVYYAIARCFHHGVAALGAARDAVVARIVAAADGSGRIGASALDTALAACALRCWGASPPELARAVRFLAAEQRDDGSWQQTALYYGGPKKYYGWGSAELTTGFCLEALARFRAPGS